MRIHRPGKVPSTIEGRTVAMATAGAALVLAFVTLARALREALFLARFEVRFLPYMTLAVVALGLPAVGMFVKLLARSAPDRALRAATATLLCGVCALWPWLDRSREAILVFYLWTSLGTLVLTSAFWSFVAERFGLRDAKRVFGLIAAGGTAGALATGLSLDWLTDHLTLTGLLGGLGALLVLLLLVQSLQRASTPPGAAPGGESAGLREGIRLIASHPYLREIAGVVFLATVASACLDFQLKDHARAAWPDRLELTSFFGAFYGYTGAAALGIQVLATGRLLTSPRGIVTGLMVLPALLLVGGGALFVLPSLVLVTVARGADNALRRGLFRPLMELLYVPLPAELRRRTKPLVDSAVDTAGEGFAALLILGIVTFAGFSSRWLSLLVVLAAVGLLVLGRRTSREYVRTIAARLRERDPSLRAAFARLHPGQRDLLSSTLTQLTVNAAAPVVAGGPAVPDPAIPDPAAPDIECSTSAAIAALGSEDSFAAARDRLRIAGPAVVAALGEALVDADTPEVVRRRIPLVLVDIEGETVDAALLAALRDDAFAVRQRAAITLGRRRRHGVNRASSDQAKALWSSVIEELDGLDAGHREGAGGGARFLISAPSAGSTEGRRATVELRLEQVFRLLALVLDPRAVRAAYHGLVLVDARLRDLALEYLEQSLPAAIRDRLWAVLGETTPPLRPDTRHAVDVARELLRTEATRLAADPDPVSERRFVDE